MAVAAVADLGQRFGGGDDRLRVAEERLEDLPVGVVGEQAADLAGRQSGLLDERLERCDQAEHDRSARLRLELARSSARRRAQPAGQLGGADAPPSPLRARKRASRLAPSPRVSPGLG
jgi:hypothetical protein